MLRTQLLRLQGQAATKVEASVFGSYYISDVSSQKSPLTASKAKTELATKAKGSRKLLSKTASRTKRDGERGKEIQK